MDPEHININSTVFIILIALNLFFATSLVTIPLTKEIYNRQTEISSLNKYSEHIDSKKSLNEEEVLDILRSEYHNAISVVELFEELVKNKLISPGITFTGQNGEYAILDLVSPIDYDIRYLKVVLENGGYPNLLGRGISRVNAILSSAGDMTNNDASERIKLMVDHGLNIEEKDFHGDNLLQILNKKKETFVNKEAFEELIEYIEKLSKE